MTRSATILLLALAAGCTCQELPVPEVTVIEPAEAPNDVDTVLTVRGAHFLPAVKADMDAPGRTQVSDAFALALVDPDGTPVALAAVMLVSEVEIRATLPAGASAATYDLRLVDPRGRVAALASALLVYIPSCSNPPAPDGTPCKDGNRCTRVDACQGGACVGSSPVACGALDACHPGTCDPGTGLCSNPPAPDGTPCRSTCLAGEACLAGACVEPPTGCLNTAPLACLVVSPATGAAGPAGTGFTYDASCSSDFEDDAAGTPLSVRIDFGDAGAAFDWQFPPAGQPHVYASAGVRTATAEVTDAGGLTSYAQASVVVYDPAALVTVTTADDESDPGATPLAPGSTGLSLREAAAYVNAAPSPMGIPWTVGFADGLGPIALASPLPALTAAGAALVGRSDASGLPAIRLDFGGANQPCITLGGPGQLLAWLSVAGCDAVAILLAPGSAGSQVAQVWAQAPPTAQPNSTGVSAQAPGTIGPRNRIVGWTTGVRIAGTSQLVDDNVMRGAGTGLSVSAVPPGVVVEVRRNRIHASAGAGMEVAYSGGSVVIRHNLFHENGADGLTAATATLDVRDNLFTGNGHFGVNAPPGDFAAGAFDHNGFSSNGKGATNNPLAPGPTDVLADPLYMNETGGDFRLSPDSPAVNAGVDTGLDVNGPAQGLYSGPAPDLGPEETPY